MTPHDHAKTLGLIYIIAGGILTLLPLGFFTWALLVSDAEFKHSLSFLKWSTYGLLLMVGVLVLLLVALSVILTGVGLLKKKGSAKIPAMIFSALAVWSFPFGTGLAVYTWWFLHSEGGKRIYSKPTP